MHVSHFPPGLGVSRSRRYPAVLAPRANAPLSFATRYLRFSPTFGPRRGPGCHGFAAMALRVEPGQALGERQWGIVQWCDENLAFLNGQAYPLVDTQPNCARNGCGQAHSEIVAPLLDVQSDFVHVALQIGIGCRLYPLQRRTVRFGLAQFQPWRAGALCRKRRSRSVRWPSCRTVVATPSHAHGRQSESLTIDSARRAGRLPGWRRQPACAATYGWCSDMEREPEREPERVPRFGRLLLVCVLAVAFCGWLVSFTVNYLPNCCGP